MDVLSFLLVIAVAVMIYYLFLHKLFQRDLGEEVSKVKVDKLPLDIDEAGSEPTEGIEDAVVFMTEPGIDSSYKEITMGPSVENIYEAEDYYEGSPADEPPY